MKQIVCMKWGTAYGAVYVNALYSMIARNITGPWRLVCLTDNPDNVRKEVTCFDCPTVNAPPPHNNGGWRKIALWDRTLADLEGDVLFLDLDVVIVDSLDPLFEYPCPDDPTRDWCVIRNWTQPKLSVGNTSVFRFRVGSHPEVLDRFNADPVSMMKKHINEQIYVTRQIGGATFWPEEWCCSFKMHCIPPWPLRFFQSPRIPKGARIVAFTGTPNPHEAAQGQWPAKEGAAFYKKLYKHIRPTPWVQEYWGNAAG